MKAGDPAGSSRGGYTYIRIDRKRYAAHRLAWLYVYGTFPPRLLDHINGCPGDNRIGNLREATPHQNAGNTRLFLSSY
jgi:hypothetical protein